MDGQPGGAVGVVILAALPLEARALVRAVSGRAEASVHVIGLGASRLPKIEPGSTVIVAGLAGGLDPALCAGDLVYDGPSIEAPPGLPWHAGRIHSVTGVITTPAQKAALFGETGALAVDMEHAAVRRAVPAGVRVIGLRAISDPADMAIDPAVLRFVDGRGRLRPANVAATLLRRPGLLGHVMRLRAHSALALRNLGTGVAALLERFPRAGGVAYAPPDHL